MKKSTVNSALTEPQTIYNMAIKYGRYDGENPFKSIDKYRIPKNPHDKYLDFGDVDRLVQAAADYCSKDINKVWLSFPARSLMSCLVRSLGYTFRFPPGVGG